MGAGLDASLAASHPRRVLAKATASASRRADGAVATASPDRASIRKEMRWARRLTRSRTVRPSTSTRSPSIRTGANQFIRNRIRLGRSQRRFAHGDEIARPGIDLLFETAAVEHAVVADARLDVEFAPGARH